MAKLSILIYQNDETDEDVRLLLNSIALQQAINVQKDVEVIIANDGSNVFLSDEFLNHYNFDIQYLKLPKKGIGATYNSLIDSATGDYLLFCKALDVLTYAFGISNIFKELQYGCAFYYSPYYEQLLDKEIPYFTLYNTDNRNVYGKIYNKQYLKDNNIRWNEDNNCLENILFHTEVLLTNGKGTVVEPVFYLHKKKKDYTNTQEYYLTRLNTFDNYLEKGLTTNWKENISDDFIYFIFECYYLFNDQELQIEFKKRLKECLNKYINIWNNKNDYEKVQIANQARDNLIIIKLETKTFYDWLEDIKK